jgi:hypothetical protein
MIPTEKVFLLFDNDDSLNLEENELNSIYMRLGMFNKIIENSSVIFLQVKAIFKNMKNIEWDFDKAVQTTNNIIFNKAFFYIKDFNIENDKHIDSLKCFNYNKVLFNLNKSIQFFETKEEYEKCAFLFKIKDWIEEERRSLIP